MIQSQDELEEWYSSEDPWNYENNLEDIKRRDALLFSLPDKKYNNVLDIGCGNGFITKRLPGKNIIGVDISEKAIKQAKKHNAKGSKKITYFAGDFFNLTTILKTKKFDLIIITGVLYPQYIGKAKILTTIIIDELLNKGGILASVHIDEWEHTQFPYLKIKQRYYDYRDFIHDLQVYIK